SVETHCFEALAGASQLRNLGRHARTRIVERQVLDIGKLLYLYLEPLHAFEQDIDVAGQLQIAVHTGHRSSSVGGSERTGPVSLAASPHNGAIRRRESAPMTPRRR